MLARILFLLLLTMNLAAGAWWYLRAQAPPAAASPQVQLASRKIVM